MLDLILDDTFDGVFIQSCGASGGKSSVQIRPLNTLAGCLGHYMAGAALGVEQLPTTILKSARYGGRGLSSAACGEAGEHPEGNDQNESF